MSAPEGWGGHMSWDLLYLMTVWMRTQVLMLAALGSTLALTPAEWVAGTGLGINLGNTLDAPTEGSWAKPAKEVYFDWYKAAGFTSVRVPVRWDAHTLTVPPYTVNASFLDRVEQVVDWSIARGLYTLVNTHHDDWLDGSTDTAAFEAELPRLTAIWSQVAARFSPKSDLLAFEIYNEPHYNMTTAWLNAMNSAVLPVLRATNPTRNILLGGLKFMNPTWIASHPDDMVFPSNDTHLLLEVLSRTPRARTKPIARRSRTASSPEAQHTRAL